MRAGLEFTSVLCNGTKMSEGVLYAAKTEWREWHLPVQAKENLLKRNICHMF